MKLGCVIGSVWATKKCGSLAGQIFMCVQCDREKIVALDLVGAGEGDRVILAFGGAARLEKCVPADAAIIAILDDAEV